MPSHRSALHVQMLAALFGLAIVTTGFLVGIWALFYGLLSIFGVTDAAGVALGVTALLLVIVGILEYTQPRTIGRVADAHPVDRETIPEVYRVTTRVASQLDVPVPTIAVSDRDAPEALVVGFRPAHTRLILSTGTIESLDGDELEAVIAHELAHVKNRDAMVMTIVSLPVVIAGGLRSRIAQLENPGWTAIVTVPLAFLSNAVWIVGRSITARLSRVRERAADRAAAEVTGSPAVLASALRTLDREIAETPTRDLREAAGVSSLSIVSLEPEEPEKVMLGPEGDVEPSYWWFRKRLHRLRRWLFETHPPTEQRLETLSKLEREQ